MMMLLMLPLREKERVREERGRPCFEINDTPGGVSTRGTTSRGTPSTGPTSAQRLCNILNRLNFIRSYLRCAGKEGQAEEDRMMAEIKLFSLASDLFWGLWSIVNAKLSQIPFGYWDYAATRLRHYQDLKEKILVSGPLLPDGGVKRKVTHLD